MLPVVFFNAGNYLTYAQVRLQETSVEQTRSFKAVCVCDRELGVYITFTFVRISEILLFFTIIKAMQANYRNSSVFDKF